MKKTAIGICIALATSVFAPPFALAAPTLPYEQDFESGTAQNWTVDTGTWSVEPSSKGGYAYRQSDNVQRHISSYGYDNWENYVFEADFTLLSKNPDPSTAITYQVGLMARFVDSGTRYTFAFAGYTNLGSSSRFVINRTAAGASDNGTKAQYDVSPLVIGETHRVKAVVDGTSFELWLDGTQLFSCEDAGISAGKIGLYTYNCSAEFDNVVVTPIGDPPEGPKEPDPDEEIDPVPNGDELAFYTFRDNADGWNAVSGSWKTDVVNGRRVYAQTERLGTNISTIGTSNWTNYSVEADVALLETATTADGMSSFQIGFMLYYGSQTERYTFNYTGSLVTTSDTRCGIGKRIGDASATLGSIARTHDKNVFYKFKAVLVNGTLELWVDDQKLLTTYDMALTKGRVALYTYNCKAAFDNVVVKEIPVFNASLAQSEGISPKPGTQLQLDFNEAPAAGTVTAQNLDIQLNSTQAVSTDKITVTQTAGNNKSFVIKIASWLEYDKTYTIVLSDNIISADKGVVVTSKSLTFTTAELGNVLVVEKTKFSKKLANGAYESITKLSNGTIKAQITMSVEINAAVDMFVIAEVTDGEDDCYKALSVKAIEQTVAPSLTENKTETTAEIEIELPAGMTNPALRIFLWSGVHESERLAECIVLR